MPVLYESNDELARRRTVVKHSLPTTRPTRPITFVIMVAHTHTRIYKYIYKYGQKGNEGKEKDKTANQEDQACVRTYEEGDLAVFLVSWVERTQRADVPIML